MRRLAVGIAALLTLPLPDTAIAGQPKPFVRGSWSALLAAHRDRPTIVHFWGVTCGPCLVELPQWANFTANHPEIDVVMIEADPVTEAAGEPSDAPLTKAGLSRVESWTFADSFSEKLEYEIDPQWRGELPFTVLIGRDGASRSILGSADFGDMVAWLDRRTKAAANTPKTP